MPQQLDDREIAELLSDISAGLDPVLNKIMATTDNINSPNDLFDKV